MQSLEDENRRLIGYLNELRDPDGRVWSAYRKLPRPMSASAYLNEEIRLFLKGNR